MFVGFNGIGFVIDCIKEIWYVGFSIEIIYFVVQQEVCFFCNYICFKIQVNGGGVGNGIVLFVDDREVSGVFIFM